jgi:hypothetical protein
MAPEHFGEDPAAPTFIYHSIVGLIEKSTATDPYLSEEDVVSERCTGNGGDVTTAGETYQELSRLTGGLRFPICQWNDFDIVFQTIAEDVVVQAEIACDFAIPEAPSQASFDLERVAVNYSPTDGSDAVQFGQAPTSGDCQENAFYIDGDSIVLCPEACDAIRSDPGSTVDVLFTCNSTLL